MLGFLIATVIEGCFAVIARNNAQARQRVAEGAGPLAVIAQGRVESRADRGSPDFGNGPRHPSVHCLQKQEGMEAFGAFGDEAR